MVRALVIFLVCIVSTGTIGYQLGVHSTQDEVQELQDEIQELQDEVKKSQDEIQELTEMNNRYKSSVRLPEEPKLVGNVTKNEILNFLMMKGVNPFRCKILITDQEYPLCSVTDLKKFLGWDKTNEFFYGAILRDVRNFDEAFDCDDFAVRLWGQINNGNYSHWAAIPFGILVREVTREKVDENSYVSICHVVNIFITREEGELVLYEIEPQTDEITKIDKYDKRVLWIII